jgi:hypothetical protein
VSTDRTVYVMSIPDGESATLECSECGALGMIEAGVHTDIKTEITAAQLRHRNYHRELWLAEGES